MAPSREKTCELKLVLDRWGHGNMSYDPKGLRQELILSGCAVDNFLGEPESDFWGKRAELYISSPPEDDKLAKIRAEHDVSAACGHLVVREGLKSQSQTFERETIVLNPIIARLDVNPEAFEFIRRQLNKRDDGDAFSASLTLIGNKLPELEEDWPELRLQDLDVSETRRYAIGSFKAHSVIGERPRVLPIRRQEDEPFGVNVSILLSDLNCEVEIARELVIYTISSWGDIKYLMDKKQTRGDAHVTFDYWELEKLGDGFAFFGQFSYDPENSHLRLRLRHSTEDAALLMRLLGSEEVYLKVHLAAPARAFEATAGYVEGPVRDYRFEVRKRWRAAKATREIGAFTTPNPQSPFDHFTQAAAEKAALENFNTPGQQWGGDDCKRILRDWFPQLLAQVLIRKSADTDISDYESEIWEASYLLIELHNAFTWNLDRTLCNSVQDMIWAWPTERELMFAPKEWRARTSPVDSRRLADALSDYIQRIWLQHNIIDGAAINAFLFSALASAMDLYRRGAFGPTDWAHVLREYGVEWRPFWNQLASVFLGWIFVPFTKWIMLPAIAVGLMFAG